MDTSAGWLPPPVEEPRPPRGWVVDRETTMAGAPAEAPASGEASVPPCTLAPLSLEPNFSACEDASSEICSTTLRWR